MIRAQAPRTDLATPLARENSIASYTDHRSTRLAKWPLGRIGSSEPEL